MRVEIAKHLAPAVPFLAVGVDKCLRVDLELAAGIGSDIGCGPGMLDHPVLAEQNTATFLGRRARGLGKQAIQHRSCDAQLHFPFI